MPPVVDPDFVSTFLTSFDAATKAAAAQTAQSTAAAGPDIGALVALIPLANDGNIITPEHHNTIRTALQAIAARLAQAPLSDTVRVSIAPVLIPDADHGAAWTVLTGQAMKVPATGGVDVVYGWTPIQLPHGGHITSFNVL